MKVSILSAMMMAAAQLAAHAQEAAPVVESPPPDADSLSTIAVPASAPAADAAPQADEPVELEEVVVTAQKRKQSIQDVPISVTAVDAQFIKDTGSKDLAHLSLYVPNVRVDAHDLGSPQVFIRGFGTNAFNPSFESSVALVQDEIYYGRPGYFTESLFDVDRVEVLRGPQGTLFGKNTIAGVYNVTTKGPTTEWEGDGNVTYGSNNAVSVEGGAGGMFADWGGLRVSGLYRHQDGELYNTYINRNEEELTQKAGRAKFRFYPVESITTDLIVQGSHTSAPFWPYQLYKLDDDTRNYLQSFDPNVEDNPRDFHTESDTPGYIKKGSATVALNTKWDIGDLGDLHDAAGVLIVAGSQFKIDQLNELDVSPADIARLDSHERHKQLSVEARFSAEADSLFGLGQKLEFVGGGFFYDARYKLRASINAGADIGSYLLTRDFCELAGVDPTVCGDGSGLPTLPGLPVIGSVTAPVIGADNYAFDYKQTVDSFAGFGQATWHITDHWALTPGVRINSESKEVDTQGSQNCGLATAGVPVCVISTLLMANPYDENGLKRNEFDVSPKLVLQYFSGGGINLYASFAEGYKSGGFNSLSYTGNDLEFKPEKAQTYELGFKSTFFERTLRFNTTAYLTKFQDLQTLAFNGVFFDVSNAGRATSKGLEGDFMWLTPFAPLSIMGSFGVLDARYDRYEGAPAPIRDAQGNLQIGATQSLDGKRIAFAPRGTGTVTPTLTFPLWMLTGKLAGDVIYQGDQYTDTDLDPATHVNAYFLYSARFILSNPTETWSLTLGGSNLADKRVLNQVIDATFFPGTFFAQQASGRQLYATVSVNFY